MASPQQFEMAKQQISEQFGQQAYMRMLEPMTHECFRLCVPLPTTALTEFQTSCLQNCFNKFQTAHDIVLAEMQKGSQGPQ